MKLVSAQARLKMAKGLFGWEPHPTQREWFLDEHHVKVAACGRRWGKTESACVDDLTRAICNERMEGMIIAPTYDQVMLLYNGAKRLLDMSEDLKGKYVAKSTPHPEIVIGDSIIRYRTAGESGDNIRGHRAHWVRVDEAGQIKERVISAVLEPMLLDYNGQLILQGTPFGKNWFFSRFMEGQDGIPEKKDDTRSFQFPSSSNPFISADYLRGIKKKYGADSLYWLCEYCAVFVDSAGAAFRWEDIQAAIYDPSDSAVNAAINNINKYVAGIDVGMHKDRTCVLVGGLDRGMLYLVDMDLFNRQSWGDTKERIYNKVMEYNASGVIDATHGSIGDPVCADLQAGEWVDDIDGKVKKREGLLLMPVSFTSQVKNELIKKCQVRLANGLIKIPSTMVELIDEMKYFGYTITKGNRLKFEAQSSRHDDTVTALILANSAAVGNYCRKAFTGQFPVGSVGRLIERFENQEVSPRIIGLGNRGSKIKVYGI